MFKKIFQRSNLWVFSYGLITLISFITCFTLQMISTGIPIYCVDIGKSTAEAGVFAGFYSAAVIAGGFVSGRLADTKGKWNMTCLGLGLLCLSIIGKAFLPILSLFAFYQIVQGLGFSLSNVAQSAMLLDTLNRETIVRGIGYYSVIKSLSYSLGSSAAVMITEKYGTEKFFFYTLLIMLAAVILNVLLKLIYKEERHQKTAVSETGKNDFRGISRYIEIKALPASAVQFIFTFALTLTTSYLASYAKSISLLGISSYFTVNAVSMFVTRMFFSRYIEKLGNFRTLIIGLVLATLSTVGILFAKNTTQFMLLAVPNAVGISFVNPTINYCCTENVEVERRGVASSTYSLALDIGSGAGGMIWGMLIPVLGYRSVFFASSLMLAIDVYLGYRIFADSRKEK